MENFCKGLLFGMLAGVAVGGIAVAKDKKLSRKVNEGIETAEKLASDLKESVEEKIGKDGTVVHSERCFNETYEPCYCGEFEMNPKGRQEHDAKKSKN